MSIFSKLRTKKIIILLLIIFIGLTVWSIFSVWSSAHYPKVNHFHFADSDLQKGKGIKLLVLADLHDHEFDPSEVDFTTLISDQDPDIILLAGDMLNSYSEDSSLACTFVESLSSIAPVYYAMGNHELDYMETHPELVEELEAAGAEVLDKAYEDIEVNGVHLRVGGMYDYAFALDGNNSTDSEAMDSEVYSFLSEFQNTENFKIMLSHRPDSFIFGDASKEWDIDLVISGHLHGGQVVLPILGGLYGGDQGWFPEYVHGLYEKDNIHLFVTSGLSTNKKIVPRFNNPPEIAVITLESEN